MNGTYIHSYNVCSRSTHFSSSSFIRCTSSVFDRRDILLFISFVCVPGSRKQFYARRRYICMYISMLFFVMFSLHFRFNVYKFSFVGFRYVCVFLPKVLKLRAMLCMHMFTFIENSIYFVFFEITSLTESCSCIDFMMVLLFHLIFSAFTHGRRLQVNTKK